MDRSRLCRQRGTLGVVVADSWIACLLVALAFWEVLLAPVFPQAPVGQDYMTQNPGSVRKDRSTEE